MSLIDLIGGETKLRLNLGAQGFWSFRGEEGFYFYSTPKGAGCHVVLKRVFYCGHEIERDYVILRFRFEHTHKDKELWFSMEKFNTGHVSNYFAAHTGCSLDVF